MEQNFANAAVASLPQQGPMKNGNIVLKAILHLQKSNSCSVNNLKKYLVSQHGIDCQVLDATIKPIMKKAMDHNILKNLGEAGKVSECKKRRKSTGGRKKRRKSKAKKGKKSKAKKGKKSTAKGKKSAGKKRRKRRSKKTAAAAVV